MDQHSLHRGFSCVCEHAHDEVCSRRHVAASVSTCFKRNLGFKSQGAIELREENKRELLNARPCIKNTRTKG